MGSFLLRRTLQLLFVLWGSATLLFLLFNALPTNPAERFASGGGNRAPDPQVVHNLEVKFGIDKPVPTQYVNYMKGLLHGDLGTSYVTKEPVTDIVKEKLPPSLRLAFWAIVVESVVGIAAGALSARKRNSAGDWITTITAVVLSAIPVFVLAYLIKQVTGVYAYQHAWPSWASFPTIGYGPDKYVLGVIPVDGTWKYLVQPVFVLASVGTAILARITRTSMLETMRLDHVRTARAKGLTEKKVMNRHVRRNAMIPVVTVIGIDFGTLVGAAILTETVFNLPGLGSQIVASAKAFDAPVVLGLTLVVTLVYGLATMAVDISYAYFDPRVKLGDD
ncbi:ABC transporter permease [Aquihabitans sp. McL0605]|uniref:ABC transporter permease n=1 Tax=Aquihabitans sp. McL0605 TaxID=3415671 RepID=UPI003CEA0607